MFLLFCTVECILCLRDENAGHIFGGCRRFSLHSAQKWARRARAPVYCALCTGVQFQLRLFPVVCRANTGLCGVRVVCISFILCGITHPYAFEAGTGIFRPSPYYEQGCKKAWNPAAFTAGPHVPCWKKKKLSFCLVLPVRAHGHALSARRRTGPVLYVPGQPADEPARCQRPRQSKNCRGLCCRNMRNMRR